MTFGRCLLGVAGLVAAVGCSSVGQDPGEGCVYGGVSHPTGAVFKSTDGCNTCSCDSQGQVACTLAACLVDGGSASCEYGGQSYPVGASFPSTTGCNSCSCAAGGVVTCTERACIQPGPCALDANYTFGPNGGLVLWLDSATLTQMGGYAYTRTYSDRAQSSTPSLSCAPALPACGSGGIDVADILLDLADADVQWALSAEFPPVYGVDDRPVDGQVFEVKRSTLGSFLVGRDCPSPTSSSCRPIPAGVAKLVTDLRALNQQQLADPSCEMLR